MTLPSRPRLRRAFTSPAAQSVTEIINEEGGLGESVINIADYGAVGDGVADDAPALSAAIAAGIAQKLKVMFPEGTYLLASTVTITPADHDLVLTGRGASLIRYGSTTRIGMQVASGSRRVTIQGLRFQGDNVDDIATNFYAAIKVLDDVTDITIDNCRFEQAGAPIECNDSLTTRRVNITRCYFHNCPSGIHPSAESTVFDCDFVCDSVVATRGQAIYAFGSQNNISVLASRFKNIANESIQIRASNPRWQERYNFRIEGCHFENCANYSIWGGSDDHPDIGEFVLVGNTFRNCVGPIHLQGSRSSIVTGNLLSWDWEFPYALSGTAVGISATSGISTLSGHYNASRGHIIEGNQLIHRHPWVGKITINTVPAAGDTITLGDFVYTWRAAAAVEGDIQIGADTTECTTNLVATIRGTDGRMTAPNNVLRYLTDCFHNPFASSYGESTGNIAVIASWQPSFTLAKTGAHVTLTAPVDYRAACAVGIQVTNVIAPKIVNNHCDDFANAVQLQGCWGASVLGNTLTDHGYGIAKLFDCTGNVFSYYDAANRILQQNPRPLLGVALYSSISDGFSVIDCPFQLTQQMQSKSFGGRSGIVTVGDGKAYTLFWFGQDMGGTLAATRPFRWEDGDQVLLYDGALTTFKFKRTAPGALQFNDADSLVALINATANFRAAYVDFQNDLGGADPKLMIKVKANAAGVAGNAYRLYTGRFKSPADTVTIDTVPQPLTVAQLLREPTAFGASGNSYALLYGGAATLIKTFVPTQIANPDKPVFVSGFNAASQALAPVVYQADIVAGVGFTITHGVAAGTEKFFWRVG